MATHFSHAALPYPIRKARFTIAVPYLDADGDPTDPTTPDTEVSIDGAAFADCLEEVSTISGSNGAGYITLSGEELTASLVVVCAKVASGPKATLATLHPRLLPIVSSGTLAAGSASGGTLGSILAYDITGCFIRTTGGTGGGGTGGRNNQARKIDSYTQSSGVFTVAPNFETAVSTDTTYDILLPDGMTFASLKSINATTPGRTLDVTSTGEAGIDWANVGSPTTTVGLSGTTVKTATDVETDTADIQGRIPAALVSGRIDASVGAMAANVMTAAAAAADLTTELQSGLATAAALATVDTVVDAIQAKTDNLPSDPADASDVAALLAAIDDFVDTEVAAIKAVTDKLDTSLELDGAVYRFTTNALEQGPSGGAGSDVFVLRTATADGGAADSITLDAGASGTNNAYRYNQIFITSGAGAGQSRQISAYVGATQVATVDPPWDIAVDNTSEFVISPFGVNPASLTDIEGAVWDAARADHQTAGTFGEYLLSDVVRISGDSSAADSLEAMVDGTGITLTNVVLPWNAAWDAEVESEVTDALTTASLATAANLSTLTTAVGVIDDFLDTEIAAIKAKTDNLPADPADASDIASSFSTVNTKLDTIDDFLDTEVAAIKAKTDNLPSDPADASVVAGLIAAVEAKVDIVDTNVDSILVDTAEIGAAGAGLTALASQASVNTIDDFLDTEIAAIKAQTDLIPSDPADASDVAALIAAVDAKIDALDTVIDGIDVRIPAALTADGLMQSDALRINGIGLQGAGTALDPVRPA